MAGSSTPSYTYSIDAADRILDVDDAWIRFACENGAPGLTRDAVTGQSLWRFIAGDEVRSLYRILIDKVRARDTEIIVPFRCDAPDLRRDMRLTLSALRGGVVRMKGVLVSACPQRYMAILHPGMPRTGRRVPICAWCRKIRLPSGEWAEVEDALVRLRLFTERRAPALDHSVCPACRATLSAAAVDPDAA